MSRYQHKKKGLRPQDFLFSDGWFDSLTKAPGSLRDQQFQVSDCQNSNLFLLDKSASVLIDRCKGCYFFVGPCTGSIFLRNCQDCMIIGCSKQFRVRDCTECVIALWCESQPVIESSQELLFDCFPNWGYPQLAEQMASSGFSVWNNNWWDIWDFTKKNEGLNYVFQSLSNKQLKREKFVEALAKSNLDLVQGVIPKTEGTTREKRDEGLLICQPPVPAKVTWLDIRILQTKEGVLTADVLNTLNLPESSYISLKVPTEDLHMLESRLTKSSVKVVKIIENAPAHLINMIFTPFQDEH